MTGKVKMYNEEKGYGFIVGEDSTDYFVHISAVSSAEPLYRGANVTFDPSENQKGKIAQNVFVIQASANRPTFIQFGNVRVKLNNIKNYGISTCDAYYIKQYEWHKRDQKKEERKKSLLEYFFEPTGEYRWNGKTEYVSTDEEEAQRIKGEKYYWVDKVEIEKRQQNYLYITTYQGDNFQFVEKEADFDIFEKCKELDCYML